MSVNDIWFTVIFLLLLLVPIAIVYKRVDSGPKCQSPIEWRLYHALARKGYKVKTQTRCGPYYIDMTIGNIAIECDGKAFHSSPDQKKYDKRRSSYLYRNGYRSVMRFTGSEINRNVNDCVRKIEKKISGR